MKAGLMTSGDMRRFLLGVMMLAAGLLTATYPSVAEEQSPVSISVDGEPVYGSAPKVVVDDVDIQVKFDGLGAVPVLNVSTWPARRSYAAGESINFLASSNYPAWIASTEIRVFEKGASLGGEPLYRFPVGRDGSATWAMPGDGPSDLVYILRVSDDRGRFDETKPLSLAQASQDFAQHAPEDAAIAPGYGEDRTAFRNIPVYGGAITVSGRNVPAGHGVRVLGDSIPVDAASAFVVQRILPPGDHSIDVSVLDKAGAGKGLEFTRSVNIPTNEWFYVALADLTVGTRFGSDNIMDVKPGEFDNIYSKGRLAFYVKGKIQGRYLLTAAADTGEGRLQDIFQGLDKKDPRQFLSRIDPDDYYPVYGDDSTAVEDAPTRGKFYVRFERGDSRVLWGNFKTNITGTRFLRNERALYGANGVYRSEETTEFGERKTQLKVYAAQPGTLPQRDVFRGTGGSAYFLKHQDVTIGSETVSVELRDGATGQFISRRVLRAGFDYEIDYLQGLIILKAPLASTSSMDDVIRDDTLGGAYQYLVASYEFSPAATDADGYATGGRAQQWIGDTLRVGVTGAVEKTGAADQKLYGADVLLRKSEQTFADAEVAVSRGPGFGNSASSDGGLTISDTATSGMPGNNATAYRLHGQVGLSDITGDRLDGEVGAYFEKKQAGFSSLDEQVSASKRVWGAEGRVAVNKNSQAHVKFEDLQSNDGKASVELNADVSVAVTDKLTFTPAVKHSSKSAVGGVGTDQGKRTDAGAVLTYRWDEATSAYVVAQATVANTGSRKDNDRIGAGGTMPLTEKIGASGEVSTGTSGFGAKAGIDYHPTADDHSYLGYRLDPDRASSGEISSALAGDDLGVIVVGSRHRFSEEVSVFAEDSYDIYGDRRSLTQTYGVNYTPTAAWNFGGGLEIGRIGDDTINSASGLKNSDFDRVAASLSAAYHGEDGVEGRIKGEARFENSDDGTRDRDSYLVAAGASFKTSENWRLITNLDAVVSNSATDLLDGNYAEGSVGYAYRPVDHDRLNALFKYTLLYDYPGAEQITVNGTKNGPAQLNNILSADISYDLNRILTIGAKYGFRIGETKDRSGVGGWEQASAHLGIVRTDFHIVERWDALLEARALWDSHNNATDTGFLAAIYRDVNENFKIGVGYNWGRFSDDLRDLTYDDHGVFLNAVGKF